MKSTEIISKLESKSTPELVDLAVAGEQQGHNAGGYSALQVLQSRGTQEVMCAALDLSRSPSTTRRRLSAKILGELGLPSRAFPEECCDTLLNLAQHDPDCGVVADAIFALGHLGNRRCETYLVPLRHSPNAVVRQAVAFALCGSTSVPSIEVLLELMEDSCAKVRDWATTSIGQTVSVDGSEVRRRLLQRATDADEQTRAEALHGLARRGDRHAIPHLITALLEETEHIYLFIDAAKAYLGIEDSRDISAAMAIELLRLI